MTSLLAGGRHSPNLMSVAPFLCSIAIIAKMVVPMCSITEGLILRSAAAAQRIVIFGRTFAPLFGAQMDCSRHTVWAILRNGDLRRTLDAVAGCGRRESQSPGGALLDLRGYHIRGCPVWIDPRFLMQLENRGQFISAEAGVLTDTPIVEDCNFFSSVDVATVRNAAIKLLTFETDCRVRAITEWLVRRTSTAT